MLHCVVEHVEEKLRELVRIAAQTRQRVRPGDIEAHARILRLHLECGDRAFEQTRGRDVLAGHRLRARLQARDLKKSLDHAHEPARLAVDDLRHVRDSVAARLALDDRLREPLDRRERRAQLMRDIGEEGLLAPT